MLDISGKRQVITRKSHECFGCLETINKGETAILISATEDNRYRSLYFHEECNRAMMKNKIHQQEKGIYYGCVSEKQRAENKSCYWCLNEIPVGINFKKYYNGQSVEFCSVKCRDEEELCPF